MKNIELSKLKAGETAIIKEINLQGILRYRLLELGIVENTKVKLIKYAPLGDPIQISIRGYNLAIRKEIASKIKLEKINEWRRQ